jgi:hypothetical protein
VVESTRNLFRTVTSSEEVGSPSAGYYLSKGGAGRDPSGYEAHAMWWMRWN